MTNSPYYLYIATHDLIEAFRCGLLHLSAHSVWLKSDSLSPLTPDKARLTIERPESASNEIASLRWLPISRITEIEVLTDASLVSSFALGSPLIPESIIRRISMPEYSFSDIEETATTAMENSSAQQSEISSGGIASPLLPDPVEPKDNMDKPPSAILLDIDKSEPIRILESVSVTDIAQENSGQPAEFNRILGMFAYSRTVGALFTHTYRYRQVHPNWVKLVSNFMTARTVATPISSSEYPLWIHDLWGDSASLPVPVRIIRDWARKSNVLMIDQKAVQEELRKKLSEENCKKEFPEQVIDTLAHYFKEDNWLKAVETVKKIPVENHPTAWAALITLLRYGNRSTDHPDHVNLKHQLARDWPHDYGLPILAAIGYFYGYEHLHRCEDRLHGPASWVKYIQKSVTNQNIIFLNPEIKFNLSQEQERCLIEAVYNHCFLECAEKMNKASTYSENASSESIVGWFFGMRTRQILREGWNSLDFDWAPNERAVEFFKPTNGEYSELLLACIPKDGDYYEKDEFWSGLEELSEIIPTEKALSGLIKKRKKKNAAFKIFTPPINDFLFGIMNALPNHLVPRKPKDSTKNGLKGAAASKPDHQATFQLTSD